MINNLSINWQAIVEEAKQRRKEQRLSQKKLAKLSGVSVAMISRFESGQENIYMSLVLDILQVLGMKDSRTLEFPDNKGKHSFDLGGVVFIGVDGDREVQCIISYKALDDLFEKNANSLRNFSKNRQIIQAKARKKYLNDSIGNVSSIMLTTKDFEE